MPSEPEETPAPEPEPPVVEADPELEPENSQEPVVDEAPKPEASADSSEETAPVDGDGEPIPETFAVATQTDLPDEQNAASDPELEDPVETPQPEPDMDESTETPQPEPDVNESVEPPSLSRKQIKTWSRRRFLSRTSRLPATRASSSSPRRAPDSRFT